MMQTRIEQAQNHDRMCQCKDNIQSVLFMLQSISELLAGYRGDMPLDTVAFFFLIRAVEKELRQEMEYLHKC
ncbi:MULTISPECIES: hypothetical protein [unclassified Neisseria]|uniref:hypothetical protein n=1 Tax=unclassified Neisseria TaxID=2623750 RepID=UPI00266694D4|nr:MULTISPECIES: hypothetical protein [unclassified Neisseria]MDO1510903.1 hypothetical protein [Neisseria sp. MVDL19-042950]MDO1517193.1 hypothetical protein [Neisseria sp. MVDL18-041461]MDO1564538.1 hypothetical protein [Neisseria sp. MVDL20-010259]